MNTAERKSILENCVSYYLKNGYRVNSITETSAQLVNPKEFNGGNRGRTASYPTGPAQIPACGIIAPGFSEILVSAKALSRTES